MMPTHVVHNAYSPREATEQCSRAGVAKANMRIDKIFFSSVMAGAILALACAATLSTNTAPWYQEVGLAWKRTEIGWKSGLLWYW